MVTEEQHHLLIDECKEWVGRLKDLKEEVAELRSELYVFAPGKTDQEVLKGIEHFHNQFVIQNENVDILKHDIHQATKSILKNENGSLSDEQIDTHKQMKEQFESELKVYVDLKTEFENFIAN